MDIMARGTSAHVLLLSGLWGASYLFIKVAVEDMEPATMMATRACVAGVILLGYVVWTMGAGRAATELRGSWREALVLGAFNAAIPFWLIAWGRSTSTRASPPLRSRPCHSLHS
jgi:drug/metabolite transporter (DMT)-like permease